MFNNFNLLQLFNIENIFDLSPRAFTFYKEFIFIFLFIFILSIFLGLYNIFFIKNRITKKLVVRIRKFLFSLSFWSFFWLFFRWQKVYIFSARFIFYLILLIYFVRLVLLAHYYFFNYNKNLEEYNKKQIINKYMPRKKNKNRKKNK